MPFLAAESSGSFLFVPDLKKFFLVIYKMVSFIPTHMYYCALLISTTMLPPNLANVSPSPKESSLRPYAVSVARGTCIEDSFWQPLLGNLWATIKWNRLNIFPLSLHKVGLLIIFLFINNSNFASWMSRRPGPCPILPMLSALSGMNRGLCAGDNLIRALPPTWAGIPQDHRRCHKADTGSW